MANYSDRVEELKKRAENEGAEVGHEPDIRERIIAYADALGLNIPLCLDPDIPLSEIDSLG